MGEGKRKLYSSPYTYHLRDMERNNCWMQNHHHAGHRAGEEERVVAAMKNLRSPHCVSHLPGLGVDSGDAQHGHVQAALLDWIQLKNKRIHPVLGTLLIYPKYLYKEFENISESLGKCDECVCQLKLYLTDNELTHCENVWF